MTDIAPDLTRFHAQRRPDVIALANLDSGATYTWAELDERVGRAATVLHDDFAVRPGDRVGLVCENDPRVFELQFACMRLGAIIVPLNWRLALPELHNIVQDAGPALLVHDDEWPAVATELAEKIGVPTLSWGDEGGRYESLLAAAAPLAPQVHDLDEITHVLYTSGTTGTPKGALSSHGTLLWQATNLSHVSSTTARSHLLNPLPLFHAGGLHTMAMPVLHYGGRVTTMRRFRPDVIAQQLLASDEPVTHLSMIPMMYAAIGAQPGIADADLSHVRCAVVAGAIAPPELLQAWHDRGVGMQPQYGGTEMGPCALVLDLGNIEKAKLGSSGRPPLHTEIRLVDPGTGGPVPQGRPGEIQLRGPSITRGYWSQPPGASRDDEGWFHTGDVAWQDEDGYFYYAGRAKEMYKSGGESVYPAEVEVVLGASPDVEEIAIIAVADKTWGEVGLAVVVAVPGRTPTLEALRTFGAPRLAKYKLPAHLVVVEALARNVTGKVSREQLKERYGRSGS